MNDLQPCRSPYCECSVGACSHPGCYDARSEPVPPLSPAPEAWGVYVGDELMRPFGDIDSATIWVEKEVRAGSGYTYSIKGLYTAPRPAPPPPPVMLPIPVELLRRISHSLGAFCSNEGWAQADMDTMDSLDAYLAKATP